MSPDFGKRLRALRKARGFTRQDDFAKAADVAQSRISEAENGKVPKVEILTKLADALKCSIDYLLGRSPIPESTLEELTPYERDMVAWSRGLDRQPTTTDFLNYRLDRHPDNPKLDKSRKAPKTKRQGGR